MAFGISAAQTVALWMETLFMGFYLVTCGFALRVFLWHDDRRLKKPSEIHWILFITAICLCIIAVFDVGLGLLHGFQAFISYTGPGGSDEEFANISDWVNVMKSVNFLVQTMLGDGMLVYRCWIVYSKSLFILIVPCILFLGDLSCAIVVIFREATLRTRVLVTSTSDIRPVFTAFFSASISLNILTTTLIVIRIWRVERENSRFAYQSNSTHPESQRRKKTRLGRIMRVIIESGLIITMTSLISLITYVTESNSAYVTTDVLVQNIGIAFNLIIIRARSQPSDEYTLYSTTTWQPALRIPIVMRKAAHGTEDLSQGMVLDNFDSKGSKGDLGRHVEISVDREIHEGDHIRAVGSREKVGNNKLGVNTV